MLQMIMLTLMINYVIDDRKSMQTIASGVEVIITYAGGITNTLKTTLNTIVLFVTKHQIWLIESVFRDVK